MTTLCKVFYILATIHFRRIKKTFPSFKPAVPAENREGKYWVLRGNWWRSVVYLLGSHLLAFKLITTHFPLGHRLPLGVGLRVALPSDSRGSDPAEK